MTYRVDNHQPRNLYRGDAYIGVCFDPADTALIVDAMESRRAVIDSAIRSVGLCPERAEHHLMSACGSCCYTQLAYADAPSHPLSAPRSAQKGPVGGSGRPKGSQALSGFEITSDVSDAVWLACTRCRWAAYITPAELTRRADEHGEECR